MMLSYLSNVASLDKLSWIELALAAPPGDDGRLMLTPLVVNYEAESFTTVIAKLVPFTEIAY